MPACLPARVPGLVDEFSKFTFDVTKGLEVQKVSRMGKKRQCVMKLQKQRNGQTVRGASSYPPSISRDRLSLVYTRLSLQVITWGGTHDGKSGVQVSSIREVRTGISTTVLRKYAPSPLSLSLLQLALSLFTHPFLQRHLCPCLVLRLCTCVCPAWVRYGEATLEGSYLSLILASRSLDMIILTEGERDSIARSMRLLVSVESHKDHMPSGVPSLPPAVAPPELPPVPVPGIAPPQTPPAPVPAVAPPVPPVAPTAAEEGGEEDDDDDDDEGLKLEEDDLLDLSPESVRSSLDVSVRGIGGVGASEETMEYADELLPTNAVIACADDDMNDQVGLAPKASRTTHSP